MWMLGIKVEGETNILSEKKRLCVNYSIPEYILNKTTTQMNIMCSVEYYMINRQ